MTAERRAPSPCDALVAAFSAAPARPLGPSSDYDLAGAEGLQGTRHLRPAGVLVAVQPWDGTLVLTKRSSRLKHHPGQIAFPGGKVDDTDSDVIAAALREAQEEVALPPDIVQVLGTLPPHETVTRFSVTPVLALLQAPFVPVPEAGEVDEVFTVPLAHVTDPRNFVIEGRRWRGQRRRYYAVPWGPYYIWGATARILRQVADAMAP